MIRSIIFDWSGTLVDDLPAALQATNHVLRQAGVEELTLDRFRAEFSLPFIGFYQRFVPHVSMAQVEEWFHARFREVQHQVEELPHAREFLEFCHARGVRSFLLSTLPHEHFTAQTKRNGFDRYLERPYLGVWDKRARITEVLRENSLNPAETLFVGDMQHDIETARHGGVFSCAVLTGFNKLEQLRASEPDLIVEHLGELREILDRGGMDIRSALRRNGTDELTPISTVGALIFDPQGACS
ncbi:MAG: HAD family hydrolase [Verrucomicrobiota bacterium]